MEQKKKGLGIVTLILGIVGFMTGIIGIGIFIDVIAIILGIICMFVKKHRNGLAIGGLVVGSIGLLLMLIIGSAASSIFESNTETTIQSSNIQTETTENFETTKEDISVEDLIIEEYSYENTIGDTLYFLVITNNSSETIQISSNATAYDEQGNVIGADSSELNAVGNGCQSILTHYFSSVENVKDFEYTLSVEKETYYQSVIQDVKLETSILEDKVIVTCTNNGSESAEFLEATALFMKENELVYYGSKYVTDDNSELKPNATISEQIEAYGNDFDDVKVYLTGRK